MLTTMWKRSLALYSARAGIISKLCQKNIYKLDINPLCCLCYEENETISHVVSDCKMLTGTKYTKRNKKICLHLHWCSMQYFWLPVYSNWHQPKPKSDVQITKKITLSYDMTQAIDEVVEAS
eukprot:1565920-Ditylum_brightwellii.AAC.1